MKGEPVEHIYRTNIKWIGLKKGILSSEGKPDINVACPPEFGGHPNIWSPEDLFLASIEVCTMTSFLYLAARSKITINSYESKAKCSAKLVDGVFKLTDINIFIKIHAPSDYKKERIEKLLEKLPKICLVSNSIDGNLKLTSEIILD
jgi:organic hydroperoxide reductase OsmC/OhrA